MEFIDQMNIDLSIIISTYNRPSALRLVLEAICVQIDQHDEIVIADDGSTLETRHCIEKIKREFPDARIKHVWQEDRGFRLAQIRNLAVKKAEGQYLIFLDGDCVPSPSFVSTHRCLQERGWLVYGQRILTSKFFCNELEQSRVNMRSKKFWSLANMLKNKIQGNINRILPAVHWPYNLFRKQDPENWDNIRGCNWAIWKADYVRVNGSDESFHGWGSEDKDLAVRLLNSGVRIKNGKFGPFVLHLWHNQEQRNGDSEKNRLVLKRRMDKTILPTRGMFD